MLLLQHRSLGGSPNQLADLICEMRDECVCTHTGVCLSVCVCMCKYVSVHVCMHLGVCLRVRVCVMHGH